MEFLRRNTDRTAKITLPGPFTMTQQAKNEFYEDEEELAMDFAAAVNAEARDLRGRRRRRHPARRALAAQRSRGRQALRRQGDQPRARGHHGADRGASLLRLRALVQQQADGYSFLPSSPTRIAQQISIEAAQPKLDLGVLKDLSRKKIMLGVIDLGDQIVETPEQVAERIRAGLKYVSPERLIPAPDCGMKYLPREVAFGKLKALADGAAIVRKELSKRDVLARPGAGSLIWALGVPALAGFKP